MPGPLEGLRVFDLTLMMVGPWSTQNLGQMGAEVFHVERGGTDERSIGGGIPPSISGTSVLYIACNMNKRQMFLDLKADYDRDVARKVAASCDVFVENMRPGVVDRLGLSYEVLHELNPHLVYVSVSGWGDTGPMASRPATDNRVQAFAGFSSINGVPGSSNELYRHYTQIDANTGNYVTQAVLLALMARERTGRGQRVDLSMIETGLALQTSRIGEYLATGQQPQNLGSASSATAPNEAFLCEEDGYLGIEARTELQWLALCEALGLQHATTDPRFETNALRLQNREALSRLIGDVLVKLPARWWQLELNKAGVPNGKLTRFDELVNLPQARDNGYMRDVETPWGPLYFGGMPWEFSRTPGRLEPAQPLGEDTAAIFDEAERLPEPPPRSHTNGVSLADSRPPLAGVRVLELAQGIAGPYAGVELADAGADVIKVEHVSGDIARHWQPRGAGDLGAAFIQLNRGKRSVVLDLTSNEGIEALRELAAGCDVLIEDADLTRELNLDVASLIESNPSLVHNRISGWGPHGPWADLPGSELAVQMASEATTSLGRLGEAPVRIGADLASTSAGIYSVQGILAALWRRERDGQGQRVEVSLYGTMVVLRSVLWASLSNPDDWVGFHLDSYRKPPEAGIKTKDGIIAITLGRLSDEGWASILIDLGFNTDANAAKIALLRAVGNPDTSPRGWEARPVWEEAFTGFTTEQVIEVLERGGANGFPVNNYAQVLAHPQTRLLEVTREVPLAGQTVRVIRSPWRFSETPAVIEKGPPLLGEHTDAVLAELRSRQTAVAR